MNQYLVQVRATSSMKNDQTFTFHLILWQTRKQFSCVIMTKNSGLIDFKERPAGRKFS